MSDVARSTEALRTRIQRSPFSLRQIAREADVSDSTVRRFVQDGTANLKIATRIEQALETLDRSNAGGDADVAH